MRTDRVSIDDHGMQYLTKLMSPTHNKDADNGYDSHEDCVQSFKTLESSLLDWIASV